MMGYTGSKKRKAREYFGLVWILPALAMLCVFCLYPTVTAFTRSFTDWEGGASFGFVGFENYSAVFSDRLFFKSLLNVVILTAVGMVLGN
ncbi:MAG: sugar ABC transporter permease, partial [Clostridia bacterium]|nr:sugar ABC transporter permease [Clostridia bacterium]